MSKIQHNIKQAMFPFFCVSSCLVLMRVVKVNAEGKRVNNLIAVVYQVPWDCP